MRAADLRIFRTIFYNCFFFLLQSLGTFERKILRKIFGTICVDREYRRCCIVYAVYELDVLKCSDQYLNRIHNLKLSVEQLTVF